MKISLFGTGYVGLVTGACLANLGHQVLCCDVDEQKVTLLKENKIPFYEPGLKDLVERGQKTGRLMFTTENKKAVEFAQVIFNCVGTPANEDGSADLQYIFSVVETVAQNATLPTILINKSTVPPGTARRCQEKILLTNNQSLVRVVSNPEFLKEGSAVHDFTHPDKIVVGAKDAIAYEILHKVYFGLERPYMKILETSWETSEMIKYANNAFLSTKISFINEIANISDVVGADIKVISQALGKDYRISPKFLNAGIGYAGSCFPKDVQALASVAQTKGYTAKLLKEVHELNERQKRLLLGKISLRFPDLTGKTISLLGLSFKPKTSDIRSSASLILIKELLEKGANIRVHDPVANNEVEKIFGKQVTYCSSPIECAKESSALVLVTEWDEFRNVDFNQIGSVMRKRVLFDGRNIYDPATLKSLGFEYVGIGRQ